jgi:hypothetical protein
MYVARETAANAWIKSEHSATGCYDTLFLKSFVSEFAGLYSTQNVDICVWYFCWFHLLMEFVCITNIEKQWDITLKKHIV